MALTPYVWSSGGENLRAFIYSLTRYFSTTCKIRFGLPLEKLMCRGCDSISFVELNFIWKGRVLLPDRSSLNSANSAPRSCWETHGTEYSIFARQVSLWCYMQKYQIICGRYKHVQPNVGLLWEYPVCKKSSNLCPVVGCADDSAAIYNINDNTDPQ